MADNQVATIDQKVATVKTLLSGERFKKDLALALPKHCNPDRQLRVMLTCIGRTPLLAECTQTSLFNSLLTCSGFGLEPDGRQAHLIPFRNSRTNTYECQLIVDYKGLVEMAHRSGKVSYIHADLVCDKDDFVFNKGVVEKHTINFREKRGEVYAVYALCRFKDGTEASTVLSMDEVEDVRKRSKSADKGPWVTDYGEMAKKSAFRRLSKWIPLSAELKDALDNDLEEIRAEIVAELESRFVTAKVLPPASPQAIQQSTGATDATRPVDEAGQGEQPDQGSATEPAQSQAQEQKPTPPAATETKPAPRTEAPKAAAKVETAKTTQTPAKLRQWKNAEDAPALREKLTAAGVTEEEFAAYVRDGLMIDGTTIDQFAEEAPSYLARCLLDPTMNIVEKVKAKAK